MNPGDRPVRVRIAPSPTGDPHVGTAYVGLINHAFARQNGGQFILRIEDTDRERSTRASEEAIYEALHWVGLTWDEGPDVGGPCGPYRQSERADLYREHAQMLLDRGAAYPCFCTAERLEALRQKRRAEKSIITGYDGLCRHLPRDEAAARMKSGEPYVIRMAMPTEGTTTVNDRLRGEVTIDNRQIDDQVLMKTDGFPTYHMANVVDDRLMGITHVIRAEEWITSTPKHIQLYKAFGWEPPEFAHLPLLRNKDKSKISKRKNPVSLLYYRHIGILPEAMLNFLAMLGHSMKDEREIFSLDEFIAEFSFDRVSLGGPVFDLEKLMWLNGMRIRAMDPATLAGRLRESVFSADNLVRMIPLVQERMRTLGEFPQVAAFFHVPQVALPMDELAAAGKGRAPKEIADVLSECIERTDALKQFEKEPLEALLRAFCEEKQLPTGDFFMWLRIALTGRKATPPLVESMCVIGRAGVAQRLRTAAESLRVYKPKG